MRRHRLVCQTVPLPTDAASMQTGRRASQRHRMAMSPVDHRIGVGVYLCIRVRAGMHRSDVGGRTVESVLNKVRVKGRRLFNAKHFGMNKTRRIVHSWSGKCSAACE